MISLLFHPNKNTPSFSQKRLLQDLLTHHLFQKQDLPSALPQKALHLFHCCTQSSVTKDQDKGLHLFLINLLCWGLQYCFHLQTTSILCAAHKCTCRIFSACKECMTPCPTQHRPAGAVGTHQQASILRSTQQGKCSSERPCVPNTAARGRSKFICYRLHAGKTSLSPPSSTQGPSEIRTIHRNHLSS